MKLRLAHVYGNSAFGGDTVYIFSLMEMAAAHGIEAELIAGDPEVIDQARLRGLACVSFTDIIRPIRPWKDIVAMRRLAHLLKARRYQIVHTHTSKGGAIGRLAARRARVPNILHTVQGFAFHEFSGRATVNVLSTIERVAGSACDRIISVNSFDRQWALQLRIVKDPQKIVTIYNGVSPERLSAVGQPDRGAMLRDLAVQGDVTVVVNLARLAPQKAQRYLLEAMPTVLAHAKRPAHLLFVGHGEDEKALREMTARLGLEENIHFLGFRRNALAWLKIADVSVLSSLWEGHSLAILEAMGMGVPVIATDIKGNRETIDHNTNGLLVKPRNARSLGEAIIRYANEPELARRHAAAAQEKFFAQYTEKHVQDNTWAVYRHLLEDKRML